MLATATSRNDYIGAGSVGPFPYTFKIWAASDLRVIKQNTTTKVETVLNYPADYAVSGVGKSNGGNVTLSTALAAGNNLIIKRFRPLTQTTDLRNQGTYFREDTEDALDKLAMIDQQQQENLSRLFGLDETVDPSAYDLLVPVGVAGQVIGWSLTGLTNLTLGTTSGVALPGEGRTVASLSAYLANNAVYNIRDYGAPVNGVNSDVAGWQLAHDRCAVGGGGIIDLTKGKIILDDTVWYTNPNITTRGMGGSFDPTVTKPTWVEASSLASGKDAIVCIGPAANSMRSLKFKDFYLSMNAPAGQVGGAGLKVWNASYFEYDAHIEVNRGPTSYALQLSDVDTPAAGAGTATAAAGACIFSVSQRGKMMNGDIVTVAATPYTVSAFNYATGLSCTLSGAPTFGASAFTITGTAARAVITSPDIKGGVAGNGTPLLVGMACTSVETNVYSLNGGAANYGVFFYYNNYCGSGKASASDSHAGYAYGAINCRNLTLEGGAEACGKAAIYMRACVGTIINLMGVGNNTSGAVAPSFLFIDAGISHVTSINNCIDLAPHANSNFSIYVGAGNFDTIIEGFNATTMPKGLGGDAVALRSVTIIGGGSIKAATYWESGVAVAAASGVAQTCFTPSRSGLHIVTANVPGGGNLTAMCMVTYNGAGTVLLMPGMTQTTDARLNFTLVGSTIKVTQTLGAPSDISWSYALIPL